MVQVADAAIFETWHRTGETVREQILRRRFARPI